MANPDRLYKSTDLSKEYPELGKKTLRSYQSIASKIYALVRQFKDDADYFFSPEEEREELGRLDLMLTTAEELLAEAEAAPAGDPKKKDIPLLKVVPRYVGILQKEHEDRKSKALSAASAKDPETVRYEAAIARGHALAQDIVNEVARLNGLVTAAASTRAVVPNISFAPLEALLKDSSDIEEEMKTSGNEETPAESKVIQKFISARESARKVREDYDRERSRIIEAKVDVYYRAIVVEIIRFEADLASVTASTDIPARDPERVRLIGAIGTRSAANTDADIDASVKTRETALKKRVEDAYTSRKAELEAHEKNTDETRRRGDLQAKIDVIIRKNLVTDADYAGVSLKELRDLKQALTQEGLKSQLHLATIPEYQQALDRINRFIEKRSEVERMTFEELVEEVAGRDIWNHASFNAAGAEPRNVELYQRVFGIKGVGLISEKEGETKAQRKERLRWKLKLQLQVIKNLLTPANRSAFIARENLLKVAEDGKFAGELVSKGVIRDELMEATTCHEEYGEDIQKIIVDILKQGVNQSSPIYYNVLINESTGRNVLNGYLKSKFYASLETSFGSEKASEILEFVDLLFISLNLIDVIYAQLVAQTMTKGHSKGDKKDRTLITRPDIACVQRATRRSKLTDWSLRALPFFKEPYWDPKNPTEVNEEGKRVNVGNPLNIGPTAAKNHQLRDLRQKQILFKAVQNGRKSVAKRVGRIRTTSMLEPLFADMWQFALPQKGEYIVSGKTVFGKAGKLGEVGKVLTPAGKVVTHNTQVSDTSKYLVAEGGWEGMWSVTFKSIDSEVTEHLIEKTLEEWGTNASNAKEFSGTHMQETVEVLLTDLIERMFTVFYTGIESRQVVYRKIVEKIIGWYDGGSLAPFRTELQNVIRNITKNGDTLDLNALEKSVSGHHGDKFKLMSAKLEFSDVLMPITMGKRDERIELMNFVFNEEGYPIPNVTFGVGKMANYNPTRSAELSNKMQWYRDVVDMRSGVTFPDLEIEGDGSFVVKEETDKKSH